MHKQSKQINSLAQSGSKIKSKSSSKVVSRGRRDIENFREPDICHRNGVDSPLRQIGNLRLNISPNDSNKAKNGPKVNKSKKISRLLTSKSLSKLMTRSLSLAIKQTAPKETNNKQSDAKLGTKTKSFPATGQTNLHYYENDDFNEEQHLPHPRDLGCERARSRNNYNPALNEQLNSNNRYNNHRVASESMIVLSNGRPSSPRNRKCMQIVDDCTLEQANLSPIIGSQQSVESSSSNHASSRSISPSAKSGSTPTSGLSPAHAQDYNPVMSSTRVVMSSLTDISTSGYVSGQNSTTQSSGSRQKHENVKSGRRSTNNTLKSKQTPPRQSQRKQSDNGKPNHCDDFVNIVSACSTRKPSSSPKANQNANLKTKTFKPFKTTHLVLRDVKNSLALRMKAKQNSQAFAKLTNELATPPTKLYSPFNFCNTPSQQKRQQRQQNQLDDSFTIQHIEDDLSGKKKDRKKCEPSPKDRIASKHKRHLINQFAIDSPTGRFRETVRDVEKFQQCIEEISEAIRRARDESPGDAQARCKDQSSSYSSSSTSINNGGLNLLDCSANLADCNESPLKATRNTKTAFATDELLEFC